MESMYFRLQSPITVSTNTKQSLRSAVDIGRFRRIIVTRYVTVASMGGVVYLEHAATYDDAAFIQVVLSSHSLTAPGANVREFTDLMRYVRWGTDAMSGSAQFMLDVVAKEV